MVQDGKSSQEYPVNAGVPQSFILGPTLFLLCINDLHDDFICNIAIYAGDATLYSKYDQASDLWWQLELASELQSDLRDTVDWGWLSLLNWIGALTLPLLLKVPPRKLESWFVLWSLFFLSLLCISANVPYDHAWYTVVMSGLVLLVTSWNCWISYKNEYADWYSSFAASLEPLAHRRNLASLSLFYRYYFSRCSFEKAQLAPLPYSRGRSTRYSDRLHDFSVNIPRFYKDVYVKSCFPRTARLWNSLPIECFNLT